MFKALYCNDCGGGIHFPEGKETPECPFCGSKNQVEKPEDRSLRLPEFVLSFSKSKSEADAAFRTFAQSSFWYPKDIRNAKLDLKAIYLPAWMWSGTIETHFNGLRRANTKSGYYPESGHDVRTYNQILVPSSKAVSIVELNKLAPFPVSTANPFNEENIEHPFEPGELTERIALKEATTIFEIYHKQHITSDTKLHHVRTSSILQDINGLPALLPIFIGVYRRKDSVYQVLVNGLTGEIHGEAPFDWYKLGIIIGGIIVLIVILMQFL